jgi:hypothetical protein
MRWRWLAVALSGLVVAACAPGDEQQPRVGSAGPAVEVIVPAPSVSAAPTWPEWTERLPKVPAPAKVGDQVWATVPPAHGAVTQTALYTLDGIYEGHATLIDTMGQRLERVPAALVHAIGTGRMKVGELVLMYTWTTPAWIGSVSRIERGKEVLVKCDLAGVTEEVAVDHAERLRPGIQPLAFVAFPKAPGSTRGLVVALDATLAWLLTASGHVELVPRAALESLTPPPRKLAPGQKVLTYRWATGLLPGVVKRVLEPELRYEVALPGDSPAGSYFVGALTLGP